mgnify:CR=1 FL=1
MSTNFGSSKYDALDKVLTKTIEKLEEVDEKLEKEDVEKEIDNIHKPTWEKYALVTSLTTVVLPMLSEFESVGQEVMMSIGGAGLASAFLIVVRIGRVTVLVQNIFRKQENKNVAIKQKERKKKKEERKRKKISIYAIDPIGWNEEEENELQRDLNLDYVQMRIKFTEENGL